MSSMCRSNYSDTTLASMVTLTGTAAVAPTDIVGVAHAHPARPQTPKHKRNKHVKFMAANISRVSASRKLSG